MRYRVDGKASKFTARAFVSGMLSSLGHNPTFAVRSLSGEIEFDPADPGAATLKLAVATESLDLTDEFSGRDRWDIMHIMTEEVLEVAQYPTIGYECRAGQVAARRTGEGRFEVTLKGTLTLHGVTRNQTVTAQLVSHDDTLRAQGDFMLRQPDFGLKHVTVAGSMMKVKDEVKLNFDIISRKG